jgi:hypothetical protein
VVLFFTTDHLPSTTTSAGNIDEDCPWPTRTTSAASRTTTTPPPPRCVEGDVNGPLRRARTGGLHGGLSQLQGEDSFFRNGPSPTMVTPPPKSEDDSVSNASSGYASGSNDGSSEGNNNNNDTRDGNGSGSGRVE